MVASDDKPVELTSLNPSDPELLAAIGTVVIKWSFLEGVVEDSIAGFLKVDVSFVYTLTANINISSRLAAIIALSELRLKPNDFIEFRKIIDSITELVPCRNKVVHGLWTTTNYPEIYQVMAVKSARKLKFQRRIHKCYILRVAF
jgi:hypothetical protein